MSIYFHQTEHYGLRYGKRGGSRSIEAEELETGRSIGHFYADQAAKAAAFLADFETTYQSRMEQAAAARAQREADESARMIAEASQPATITETGQDKITAKQYALFLRLLRQDRHEGCWTTVPTDPGAIAGLTKAQASYYITAMLND